MIDSVLKGTGNSRFLKSAVPAGTSWADALAMLQDGTFPIDFNGINAEGFQQIGTPLNKANLLKDATAAQIGLPPSTTPDGMFQALGNTGELHVWRKTVVTGAAKVELEPAVSGYIVSNNGSSYNQTIKYSSTIDEKGNLSGTITTLTVSYNTSNSDLFVLKGKYFEAGTTEISSNLKSPGGVWYIPNDASIQYITGQPNTTGYPYYYTHVATKMQKVVYAPAGTTTTYPVSTNPNAYQEDDDAKPAGYTLGEVENNVQILSGGDNWPTTLYYADSVDVDNDGQLSLQSPNQYTFTTSSQYQNVSTLAVGRFIKIVPEASSGFSFRDGIWFVPSDATVTVSNYKIYASKIQKVTGYPATPAGTTIEYLGKLGDKARVQVVSYVGTGTYGSDHPNSVTANFPIKLLAVQTISIKGNNGNFVDKNGYETKYSPFMIGDILSTQYTYGSGCGYKPDSFTNSYGKKSEDGKTFYWYTSAASPRYQFNDAGYTYTVLLIG